METLKNLDLTTIAELITLAVVAFHALSAVLAAIFRLTPTKKDDTFLAFVTKYFSYIEKIVGVIVPNVKAGGQTFKN